MDDYQKDLVGKEMTIKSVVPVSTLAEMKDTLETWAALYFEYEVSTLPSSQEVQKRDISYFVEYMVSAVDNASRVKWTPRLSADFIRYLKKTRNEDKHRRWGDRTINRIVAHLKTFSKWIHRLQPFPLGDPMLKIKGSAAAKRLLVSRALSQTERRLLLDAADSLIESGGRSRDRRRHGNKIKISERPRRKGFRPYRNRAIIYALVETGMRRKGIVFLDDIGINPKSNFLLTIEKGNFQKTYNVSSQGITAIQDYLKNERPQDEKKWKDSPAMFLPANTVTRSSGRLSLVAINNIWNEVCKIAGISGKTPHSARHGMGKYIIEKTGNVAAVQRQLNHANPVSSMQYSGVTDNELFDVLEERD